MGIFDKLKVAATAYENDQASDLAEVTEEDESLAALNPAATPAPTVAPRLTEPDPAPRAMETLEEKTIGEGSPLPASGVLASEAAAASHPSTKYVVPDVPVPLRLYNTVETPDEDAILAALAKHPLTANDADESGWTVLHWATHYGHERVITAAIAQDALINTQDSHGTTPINIARACAEKKPEKAADYQRLASHLEQVAAAQLVAIAGGIAPPPGFDVAQDVRALNPFYQQKPLPEALAYRRQLEKMDGGLISAGTVSTSAVTQKVGTTTTSSTPSRTDTANLPAPTHIQVTPALSCFVQTPVDAETTAWCRTPGDEPLFLDRGSHLSYQKCSNIEAIRLGLQVAIERGWTPPKLSGSDTFCRLAFMEAAKMGVTVTGWAPPERLLDDLKRAGIVLPESAKAAKAAAQAGNSKGFGL